MQIYLQYISSKNSTCFNRIYSPSSGGTPYWFSNWYLLFFLDTCLLSWLCWSPATTTYIAFRKMFTNFEFSREEVVVVFIVLRW